MDSRLTTIIYWFWLPFTQPIYYFFLIDGEHPYVSRQSRFSSILSPYWPKSKNKLKRPKKIFVVYVVSRIWQTEKRWQRGPHWSINVTLFPDTGCWHYYHQLCLMCYWNNLRQTVVSEWSIMTMITIPSKKVNLEYIFSAFSTPLLVTDRDVVNPCVVLLGCVMASVFCHTEPWKLWKQLSGLLK